ncbi:hypothetical protein BS50DRAFT_574325 [Corynespora cassiicola Philippines]|uniref:Ams2/SPT21 N-terminal domain-containing protein n=1 Tax=Corynespora cassiicola Philippines TaxID=1448308 RepID=A0A2T2NK62_CORCC|nr:hypothetical protein BS50DRAFT_574325 [Corynespora cassiicola Philippines]
MSTPSSIAGPHASAPAPGSPSLEAREETPAEIPRRHMRVKILYTFDDENKSNCLARLPNALNIPTVSLDETTQVGVIELKTCIQAIVSASPELVAKLGHDYTVYAYDYSEYETPLVGQGMLSWILSSASVTPNAPAEESQTMVTGRVCKNIMGLFSNGIKETLEVKLKLVPVPTCLQREYVESMERYHNLSKMMPEGMDYSAWADFLRANPAIGQLAQPTPTNPAHYNPRGPTGGVEPFHHMLTRMTPPGEMMRNDPFQDQLGMPFNSQGPRPSSPAMSTASYNYPAYNHDSRPASRASVRSETAAQSPYYPMPIEMAQEQQEEGPTKKRARITKASRPKGTALDAINDSLRVTASTAASVRLHRPASSSRAVALASVEQIPRAPTPRPGDAPRSRSATRPRPPPSMLRQASIEDQPRRYMSPYEPSTYSDAAMDSADEDKGSPDTPMDIKGSPGDTPMEIPSSPPLMPGREPSSAPSSPGLPTLPPVLDSGFASDLPQGRDEEVLDKASKPWDGSDAPTAPAPKVRAKPDRSHHPWAEVTPGPMELLPKTYVPKPKTYPRPEKKTTMQPIAENPQSGASQEGSVRLNNSGSLSGDRASFPPIDPDMASQPNDNPCPPASQETRWPMRNPENMGNDGAQNITRSATPNLPANATRPTESRGLTRSQTWSGEPMSDAAAPGELKAPRSGAGRNRRKQIKDRMETALSKGEMPTFCNNCGQIETPTWRKAFMRVFNGEPEGLQPGHDASGIVAIEPLDATKDGPSYRILKLVLTDEEKASELFTSLVLCNPCGIYLRKRKSMRPPDMWTKAPEPKEKRKRNRAPRDSRKKSKGGDDANMSDACVPEFESVTAGDDTTELPQCDGAAEPPRMLPPLRPRAASFQTDGRAPEITDESAQLALWRAIQSSPVGVRGSKDSPIDIEGDLTPRPIRRLLFPSPRKEGETKSLTDARPSHSPTPKTSAIEDAEIIVSKMDETDKENCPPHLNNDNDDLSHLFEERSTPKNTPSKMPSFEDLLKTPTPGSRRRVPLTPGRSAEKGGPITPSRIVKTPRTGVRAGTMAPETPFTRQMNALFSDCIASSPSRAVDFPNFPTFVSPGRNGSSGSQFYDYNTEDFLSSDMPAPSSPPVRLDFSVFEDPNTSTVGLWSGASIFGGSDAVMADVDDDAQGRRVSIDGAVLEMNGISADLAAMIEKVVGAATNDAIDEEQVLEEESASPLEKPAPSPLREKSSSDGGQGSTPGCMVGDE